MIRTIKDLKKKESDDEFKSANNIDDDYCMDKSRDAWARGRWAKRN